MLTELSGEAISQDYQGDQSIFLQGDVGDAVFYVQSGKIELTVASARGKEAVIAVLQPNSFFGEGCLAGQPRRMSTASTAHRSTIIRVEKQVMVDHLHRYPEFAERFLAHLLSRNIRMEADLLTTSSTPAKNDWLGFFFAQVTG